MFCPHGGQILPFEAPEYDTAEASPHQRLCRPEFSFKWKCNPIEVDELLDVAVEEYTEWQHFRVSNETFMDNIIQVRVVTLRNFLDLVQIYGDQDPGFFVKHGVKVGAPDCLFMTSAFR